MQFQFSFNWEITVTTSMASGRNVLNFPREYSRNCLSNSESTIHLLDIVTGKVFKSPIITSTKNNEDKYVYSCWKKFVKENKLKFKDRVIFNAPDGNNVLQVQILRRSHPR
ncbi:unnamed protein product [Trifolium pratense]|uniref:Uncharacterized protein n=1 Tax=Trifolium pratense TaxID=57577 RepID=A0ACB0INE5_TRIPR|nr:unnamed protein product [Trifolium pratense]